MRLRNSGAAESHNLLEYKPKRHFVEVLCDISDSYNRLCLDSQVPPEQSFSERAGRTDPRLAFKESLDALSACGGAEEGGKGALFSSGRFSQTSTTQ